jgi:hypothetical protein
LAEGVRGLLKAPEPEPEPLAEPLALPLRGEALAPPEPEAWP